MSLLENTRELIEVATEKAVHTVEVQKIRFAISKQGNKLAKAYEMLGREFYKNPESDELEPLIEDVAAQRKQLAKLKKELAIATHEID